MNESSVAEQWRDVVGYEGQYQVSDQGRVRSVDRIGRVGRHEDCNLKGRVLKQHVGPSGYANVCLGRGPSKLVAPLVAEAFIGRRPAGFQVAHNNGVRTDNRAENLRWDTASGNNRDKVAHGTWQGGERHSLSKLTEAQAVEIHSRIVAGESNTAIAKDYPVTRSTISKMRNGKQWRHLNG